MIHVECYADEAVVRALGFARRRVRHQASKGEVVNAVRRSEGSTGVVDEDPQSAQPGDLENYDTVERLGSLRFLKHRQAGSKRMVLVCPYLEAWILGRAKANGIDPAQFGLPTDPRELHGIPHYERKEGFQRFLQELITEDAETGGLKSWLESSS
ncbi:MAG: hypothetical protein NTW87_19605 [Planctomycetota bacterium]|nr:hypothetical protein [Planctomycetota bacterium]